MTVAELIEELEKLDQELPIKILLTANPKTRVLDVFRVARTMFVREKDKSRFANAAPIFDDMALLHSVDSPEEKT